MVPGRGVALDEGQRAWARRWLRANDPWLRPDGAKVSLSISEAEANVLANYLIARLGNGRASVTIGQGRAALSTWRRIAQGYALWNWPRVMRLGRPRSRWLRRRASTRTTS